MITFIRPGMVCIYHFLLWSENLIEVNIISNPIRTVDIRPLDLRLLICVSVGDKQPLHFQSFTFAL